MSVPLLDALALAIYRYEGDGPGMRAQRNCNPGNLRPQSADQARDEAGYRIFPNFVTGYQALQHDLASKIVGQNTHGLNMDSSLIDLFSVYAPAGDGNDPQKYTDFVVKWLQATYHNFNIGPLTTFRELYVIARQEVPGGVTPA